MILENKSIELYLEMNPSELDLTNFRGSDANVVGKLKRVDSELWSDPNEGATNESGFSAIPGGRYNHDGTFIFLSLEGTWWSSALAFPNTNLAWLRILTYYHNGSYRTEPLGHMMGGGFSFRCTKD